MGIRYFRAGNKIAIAGTTRYITLNSSQASKIIMTSGATGISFFNQGSTPIVWGGTNIAVNSGNYIFPAGRVEWLDVQDSFELFMFSDSNGTTGTVAVQEFFNG